MTKRLYYHDAYLTEFTASVIRRNTIDQGKTVALNRTAFYPASGGQPADFGTLDRISVSDVWNDQDGMIWHLVDEFPQDGEIKGIVDWDRRFDHMQQHSGQHILSEAFLRNVKAQTIGFHLGKTSSTIDLDTAQLTPAIIESIENEVNKIIWENRSVNLQFYSQKELKDVPLRKKTDKTKNIRVIWIEDYSAAACGGTHVGSTGEIGMLKITQKQRYKGGMRIAFLCGRRALLDYSRNSALLAESSSLFSGHPDDLKDRILGLQAKIKESHKLLKKVQVDSIIAEGETLIEQADLSAGYKTVIKIFDDLSFESLKQATSKLQKHPQILLLLGVKQVNGFRLICARSSDLKGVDAQSVLASVLEQVDGKGGGSSLLAQGGTAEKSKEIIRKAIDTVFGNN